MTITNLLSKPTRRGQESLPPLENGDRLTWPEFERRWEAMPLLKRAELIDGVVYMAAAVRHEQHGRPHVHLSTWLGYYASLNAGLDLSDNATLLLDDENAPQPDLLLRRPESMGGTSRVTSAGYLQGPPELIAEVAASSVSLDLHAKRDLYRKHGVREYLVWRVLDGTVDWFALRDGVYVPLAPDAGVLKSEAFPGLWLDVAALLRGDLPRLVEVLNEARA